MQAGAPRAAGAGGGGWPWVRGDGLHAGLDLAGAAEPLLPLLLQRVEDDLIHARVDGALGRGRREAADRQLAGEHFVEHHAEGVDVGALVHVLRMLELLGRHVVRRADGHAAGR